MNCKICGGPLEDGQTVCPACGADQAVEELTAQETQEADALLSAEPEEPAEAPEEIASKPKKPGKALLITLGIVAVAAVAALVLAFTGILGGDKSGADPTDVNMVDKDGAFVAHDFLKEEMTAEEAAAVVATVGAHKLTNADLAFYYWQQYYNLYNSYGSYISYILDPEKPMAEQMYDETHSWQDKLMQASVVAFRQNAALGDAAKKADFKLSDEYTTYLDSMQESMTAEATTNGFADADAYLQSAYGPNATFEGYLAYANSTMLASSYLQSLFETIEYGEADVVKYFEDHAADFEGMSKDDPNMVNVRHILIKPVADEGAALDENGSPTLTEQNWADAEKKANAVYEQWKSGEASEDSFAALATTDSADGSAANGGLIEGVYPGQMVPEFNDWCFDAARKPGDNALIKSEFGYHVMYFSTVGEHPYWYTQADAALLNEKRQTMLDELVGKTKLKVDYSKAVLTEIKTEATTDPNAEPDAGQ